MRCDHNLPVCQNCRRRNITERCVYVEAPQTRPKSQRSGSKALSQSQYSSYTTPAPGTLGTTPTESALGISKDGEFEEESSAFGPSSGFYGPTSFSAVYNENDLGPSRLESPQDQSPLQFPAEIDRTSEQMSSRTSLGVKVLNQLPNQATCDRVFEFYANKSMDKAFHMPTLICCVSSLWSTFGQALRQPRKSKDLRDIARLLSKNTASVFRDTDDGNIWLASLSGRNLRWEMLGIIFCTLGNVLLAIPDDDPFWSSQSGRRMHRKEFAMEMNSCADDCVKLSNQMDNINILMIILLFKKLIFESQCTGDTSLMLWRAHGDLSYAATGLGLNRDRDLDSPPSISIEMRRRIWAVVFSIDKTLAAFTGRPPGLSHRYHMCPLPLDLSDDILLASEEERARAVSLLDANGWNTLGEFYPATNCRAVMIHSLIMSEILEISLGSESQYSDDRLLDLKRRSDEAHNSFPQWLHLTKEIPPSNSLQWTRLILRLRHLHCSMLMEQLSVKRVHANQQLLLDIAREMLELTVYLWVERDRFIERHYDYDWMIMCYGIPASGVICVELLKQMKQPRSARLRIPRSEVIQNLSLLVGFLEWVRPTAANRELCGRMGVIIKRILDQVLDPPPMSQESKASSSAYQAPTPEFDFGQINTGEFDWLGTVDWTQGPFVDLGTDGFTPFS